MASRPEHQAPPELFYSESEARKYTQNLKRHAGYHRGCPRPGVSQLSSEGSSSILAWVPCYTHGNISTYVISYVHNYSHPRNLDGGTTAWLYGASVMGQGASMFAGGLLELKIGPRYTALLGSVVMSAGVMLSAVAIKVSFWLLLFTYGIMFGVGSGIAYIAPIVCALRWLPKWKGVANGVVVSGVGLGGLLFDLARRGVYMTMQLIGCVLLTNPTRPKRRPRSDNARGHHGSTSSAGASSVATDTSSYINPESSVLSVEVGVAFAPNPGVAVASPRAAEEEGVELEMLPERAEDEETSGWTTNIISSVTPLKMLKTLNFYHLWMVFVLNLIGLTCIITMYKMFGQTVINDDLFFATTGSVASIFNFAGRLFWGFAADFFTFKLAIVCLCAVTTVLALTFYTITLGVKAIFFIWVCAVFFCVGGIFVLFATGVARSYGPKYFGVNYGLFFSAHSRMMQIQMQMAERALELLALPEGQTSYILDVGCGSGLSGEALSEAGHVWVGMDISAHMLSVAKEREVSGDLFLWDMGDGLGFRPGTFDGVISISALQWLCNADKKTHQPAKRLYHFFTSLYACMARGARAVFQFYPENPAQMELITHQAMRSGFFGGVVVDYPNSTKAKKMFLCLFTGGAPTQLPQGLGADEPAMEGSALFTEAKREQRKKGKNRVPLKSREWILAKKERRRMQGKDDVRPDSKYTGRKRRHAF
eukprot:Em0015g224a